MRPNEYKYELLSIINLSLEKKNYDSSLCDSIKYFSSFIKDFELEIDSISDDIKNNLENNNFEFNITLNLLSIKSLLQKDLL